MSIKAVFAPSGGVPMACHVLGVAENSPAATTEPCARRYRVRITATRLRNPDVVHAFGYGEIITTYGFNLWDKALKTRSGGHVLIGRTWLSGVKVPSAREKVNALIASGMRKMYHPNCTVMNTRTGTVARWGDWIAEVPTWYLGDDAEDTGAMQMAAKDQMRAFARVRKNRAGGYAPV